MKLLMIKSAFSPVKKKTPDILEKGSVVEFEGEAAKALIEKGYAQEVKPEPKAEAKPEKKAEKPTA